MVWPDGLKERVREQTGPRGVTDFTITAVQARLAGDGVEAPTSDVEAAEAAPSTETPRPVEATAPGPAPAIEELKERFGLVTAAEIPVPAQAAASCPTCSSALIDGSCWGCAF